MADYTYNDKKFLRRLQRLVLFKKLYENPEHCILNGNEPATYVSLDVMVSNECGEDFKIENGYETIERTGIEAIDNAIKRRLHIAVNTLFLNSKKNRKPKNIEGIIPGTTLNVRDYINDLCEQYPPVIKEEDPNF